MVGDLKNLRLATEVQLSAAADDEGKSKKPNSKRKARTKADKRTAAPAAVGLQPSAPLLAIVLLAVAKSFPISCMI